MAISISFGALDAAKIANAADLMTRLEKLAELRAGINTERAAAEVDWKKRLEATGIPAERQAAETAWGDKINAIQAEETKIKVALRALRSATITVG